LPFCLQRCQLYVYDIGPPVQLPGKAVSVCPTTGRPEIVGGEVLRGFDVVGGAVGVTGAVAATVIAADCAVVDPAAFEATTRARTVCPASRAFRPSFFD
jgi:hypothetical protein